MMTIQKKDLPLHLTSLPLAAFVAALRPKDSGRNQFGYPTPEQRLQRH